MISSNTNPSYNIRDIVPLADENGMFLEFVLKSGQPLITDYRRIDHEIVVADNVVSLGTLKVKGEICSIAELGQEIQTILTEVRYVDDHTFSTLSDAVLEFIVYQVMFDVLFDKYIDEIPHMTLHEYCKERAIFDLRASKDNIGNELEETVDRMRKWMTNQIEREVGIKNNPAMRADRIKLGGDPDEYIEFIGKLNAIYENNIVKPKYIWDYLYYNGNPMLITSKQYKRSFNKINSRGKKNNNYDKNAMGDYFQGYDAFVRKAFISTGSAGKEYFDKTMEYYYLEMYKRIDFAYRLAVRMERAEVHDISKNEYLAKRFHPVVFRPHEYQDNGLLYGEKHKYYRPLLFVDEFFQATYGDRLFSLDVSEAFTNWFAAHLLRAKTYELFRYRFKFVSDDYDAINEFFQKYYNVLGYFDPDKKWNPTDSGEWAFDSRLIKNVLKINDYLFKDSDKRKPVKKSKTQT